MIKSPQLNTQLVYKRSKRVSDREDASDKDHQTHGSHEHQNIPLLHPQLYQLQRTQQRNHCCDPHTQCTSDQREEEVYILENYRHNQRTHRQIYVHLLVVLLATLQVSCLVNELLRGKEQQRQPEEDSEEEQRFPKNQRPGRQSREDQRWNRNQLLVLSQQQVPQPSHQHEDSQFMHMGPLEDILHSRPRRIFKVTDHWKDELRIEHREVHASCCLEQAGKVLPIQSTNPLYLAVVNREDGQVVDCLTFIVTAKAEDSSKPNDSHAEQNALEAPFPYRVQHFLYVGHHQILEVEDNHQNAYKYTHQGAQIGKKVPKPLQISSSRLRNKGKLKTSQSNSQAIFMKMTIMQVDLPQVQNISMKVEKSRILSPKARDTISAQDWTLYCSMIHFITTIPQQDSKIVRINTIEKATGPSWSTLEGRLMVPGATADANKAMMDAAMVPFLRGLNGPFDEGRLKASWLSVSIYPFCLILSEEVYSYASGCV